MQVFNSLFFLFVALQRALLRHTIYSPLYLYPKVRVECRNLTKSEGAKCGCGVVLRVELHHTERFPYQKPNFHVHAYHDADALDHPHIPYIPHVRRVPGDILSPLDSRAATMIGLPMVSLG